MTRFRDLPIRRKLLLMVLTSTTVALVLAGGGFLAWDIVQFRSAARQEMLTQAAIIAENSGAPLTFGDDRVAREILRTLNLRPRVEMACLYQPSGAVLTTYQRELEGTCPSEPPTASSFGWRDFHVVTPVTIGKERVGTLYIRRELGDLYARVRVAVAAILVVLLLAVAAAFLTGARMQRSIAAPLLSSPTRPATSRTRAITRSAPPRIRTTRLASSCARSTRCSIALPTRWSASARPAG